MHKCVFISSTLLLVAAAGFTITPGTANATYPGATNGRFAFGMNVGGTPDIYSVLPNGHLLQQLTTNPGFDACAAYSADGEEIAWCSGPGPGSGPLEIWKMKQNGKNKEQVTYMGGRAFFPDFSPDGSQIAFIGAPPGSTNHDVYIVNTDGTELERLTDDADFDGYPVWSPDGTEIVFLSNRTGINQVWVMNADGSDQTQLTFDSLRKDQTPDWRPDGTQIVYLAHADAGPSGDIWLMNADGSDQHPLTSGPPKEYGPLWSPDGTQIAFKNNDDGTLNVMNADGSDRHPIAIATLSTAEGSPLLGVIFVPAWQPRDTE